MTTKKAIALTILSASLIGMIAIFSNQAKTQQTKADNEPPTDPSDPPTPPCDVYTFIIYNNEKNYNQIITVTGQYYIQFYSNYYSVMSTMTPPTPYFLDFNITGAIDNINNTYNLNTNYSFNNNYEFELIPEETTPQNKTLTIYDNSMSNVLTSYTTTEDITLQINQTSLIFNNTQTYNLSTKIYGLNRLANQTTPNNDLEVGDTYTFTQDTNLYIIPDNRVNLKIYDNTGETIIADILDNPPLTLTINENLLTIELENYNLTRQISGLSTIPNQTYANNNMLIGETLNITQNSTFYLVYKQYYTIDQPIRYFDDNFFDSITEDVELHFNFTSNNTRFDTISFFRPAEDPTDLSIFYSNSYNDQVFENVYWEKEFEEKWINYQFKRIVIEDNELDLETYTFLRTYTLPQQEINTTEVIPLRNLMLNILTMPFTFITQAFNVTLWPNTSYEFNIANFIKGIIAILAILFIIRLFTNGFNAIGSIASQTEKTKLAKSQRQLNQSNIEKNKSATKLNDARTEKTKNSTK